MFESALDLYIKIGASTGNLLGVPYTMCIFKGLCQYLASSLKIDPPGDDAILNYAQHMASPALSRKNSLRLRAPGIGDNIHSTRRKQII